MIAVLYMLIGSVTTCVIFGFTFGGDDLVRRWMELRHARLLAREKTKQLEAIARMDGDVQRRLLDTLPEWLDQDDPGAVAAWKKAQAETLKVGSRQ